MKTNYILAYTFALAAGVCACTNNSSNGTNTQNNVEEAPEVTDVEAPKTFIKENTDIVLICDSLVGGFKEESADHLVERHVSLNLKKPIYFSEPEAIAPIYEDVCSMLTKDKSLAATGNIIAAFEDKIKDVFEDKESNRTYECTAKIIYGGSGNLLTMQYEINEYAYGAHGSNFIYGVTYNRAGERLTWDMFDNTKKDQLVSLIRKGLRTYFDVKTDEEVNQYLFHPEKLGTPEKLPYIEGMADGDFVHITYQQYEIAAYAAGLPEAVIDLEELKPLLNERGKKFIRF